MKTRIDIYETLCLIIMIIIDLKYNNIIIENDQDKAEILNEYFINQSKLDDANKSPPELAEPTYERLNRVNITSTDVRDILKSLNPSKASGPDIISPRLLREGANQLCTPLSKFFNRLIISGQYPQAWKYANVTPVYKREISSCLIITDRSHYLV